MSDRINVVLDSNNTTFPNDGNPINLNGIKKIILTNIKNHDRILVIIHHIGGEFSGSLPHTEELEIPIDPIWKGIFFVAVDMPIGKQVSFTYQEV